MTAITGQQQNYVVRMVGLVTTDVEVCAASPEEAAEKAEAWAQGKHSKDEHNDLFLWDWERDESGETVWLSEDQTPCGGGCPECKDDPGYTVSIGMGAAGPCQTCLGDSGSTQDGGS